MVDTSEPKAAREFGFCRLPASAAVLDSYHLSIIQPSFHKEDLMTL